jgi:hypothetical protein
MSLARSQARPPQPVKRGSGGQQAGVYPPRSRVVLDLVHEHRAARFAVPAPIAARAHQEARGRVHDCPGTTASARRSHSTATIYASHSRICDTNPPWWPGMILNWTPLRTLPDASGSFASATFHSRTLSIDALESKEHHEGAKREHRHQIRTSRCRGSGCGDCDVTSPCDVLAIRETDHARNHARTQRVPQNFQQARRHRRPRDAQLP